MVTKLLELVWDSLVYGNATDEEVGAKAYKEPNPFRSFKLIETVDPDQCKRTIYVASPGIALSMFRICHFFEKI